MNENKPASADQRDIPRHKDRIYDSLKTDIIRCKLKPGLAVSEAKLAARYGVGKAPIRDALSRLCHESLIISRPRRGHIIAPITIRDVINLYEVRIILEPVAARMAAGKVNEKTLHRVAGACEVPFSNDDTSSVAQFLSSNSEFHRTIANFSGNQRLAKQISNLLEDTERIRHIMLGSVISQSGAIDEHRGLVEALIAGNGDAAAELSKAHIQRGCQLVMSTLLGQFHFMDINLGGSLEASLPDDWPDSNLSGDALDKGSEPNVLELMKRLGNERISGNRFDAPSAMSRTGFGSQPEDGEEKDGELNEPT